MTTRAKWKRTSTSTHLPNTIQAQPSLTTTSCGSANQHFGWTTSKHPVHLLSTFRSRGDVNRQVQVCGHSHLFLRHSLRICCQELKSYWLSDSKHTKEIIWTFSLSYSKANTGACEPLSQKILCPKILDQGTNLKKCRVQGGVRKHKTLPVMKNRINGKQEKNSIMKREKKLQIRPIGCVYLRIVVSMK